MFVKENPNRKKRRRKNYEKSLISIFQEIFATTAKISILGGGLSTAQYFHEDMIFPDIS